MSSGYRHYENTKRLSVSSEAAAATGVPTCRTGSRRSRRSAAGLVTSRSRFGRCPTGNAGWASPISTTRMKAGGSVVSSRASRPLGAPYAVFSLLCDAVEQATGRRPTAAELRAGEFKAITERVTMCVATDGNQGRGLAFGAQTFGCRWWSTSTGTSARGGRRRSSATGRSSSGSTANTSNRSLVPGRTAGSTGGISSAALPGTTSTSRSRGT
jgi:hypothetical protein